MHKVICPSNLYSLSRLVLAGLLVFSFADYCAPLAHADFSGNGDIVGTVENAGNTTSPGPLIVGNEGTAGVFGDGALPLVGGDLNPLRSDQSILGNGDRSIGAMTFEDFLFLSGQSDPRGGNWLIENDLTVGNNGQGFLDILNSARVEVAEITRVGGGDGTGDLDASLGTGLGLVTVNGTGTRLVTGDDLTDGFYVGFDGVGSVEVSGRGSIESLGFAVIGETDGADGLVTLTDRGTRWTIDSTLTIGNGELGTSTAQGRLEISNDALVQAEGAVIINALGKVTLLGGTLRVVPPLTGPTPVIANGGVIRGDGFISGAITNGGTGEIRNAAAQVINGSTVTNVRESLLVAGPVINNGGTIQSLGGAMEFQSAVVNIAPSGAGGEIIARDAEIHFRAGLTHTAGATIVIGGTTTIHGPIGSAGDIHVLAGSEATLVGDLTFTGGALGLTVGDVTGTLDVIGAIDLGAGTELELNYSSGVFANSGDTYEILDSTDPLVGTFTNAGDQVTDDNGNIWDITYNASSVFVTATGLTAGPVLGDFDTDGDVDGGDFLRWQRGGSPTPGSPGDLADWGANYGSALSPVSAATSSVPEPSTLALALLTLACCPRRRRLC